jgi:hypothetical protein
MVRDSITNKSTNCKFHMNIVITSCHSGLALSINIENTRNTSKLQEKTKKSQD